jgi:hypothetical protein
MKNAMIVIELGLEALVARTRKGGAAGEEAKLRRTIGAGSWR